MFQDQNKASTSFISIIYDNLYQYQPMMSPAAVDMDKSVFFLHWPKGVTRFIDAIQLLKLKCPKLPKKTLVNAHVYRAVVVVTLLIKTRPYINTSVKMLNQMLY